MPAVNPPEARPIGLALMAAIYLQPIIFWWFLLRRGHAQSTRIAALLYTFVSLGLDQLHRSS